MVSGDLRLTGPLLGVPIISGPYIVLAGVIGVTGESGGVSMSIKLTSGLGGLVLGVLRTGGRGGGIGVL